MKTELKLHLLLAALVTFLLAAGCASLAPHATGPSIACRVPFPIGYQVVPFRDGRSMAIWYPSADTQATFSYARDTSTTLALKGQPLSSCGAFPPRGLLAWIGWLRHPIALLH